MDIFFYNSHTQFLNEKFKFSSRPLSHEQIAQRLGYKSSRSIGMVLNGTRMPSATMILQIASYLKLDDQEKRYFELLIRREQLLKHKKSVALVERELKKINPLLVERKTLDTAYFSFIADWYHFVLKQLISTPQFIYDLNWIRRKLKNQVSLDEIKNGFKNLKLLGLIKEDKGQISILYPRVTTTHDVPSAQIRKHHQQMMRQASCALENEDIKNREFFSLTFCVKRQDIPEIKEQIRKFKNRIESQYESNESDDIFQMNLQFFSHTIEMLQSGKGV